MAEKKHPDKHHGKKPKQRMKPYIVCSVKNQTASLTEKLRFRDAV